LSTSTNLAFPYLAAGQAQKHVTVNETLLRLDAIVQLAVVSATVTAQPGSPSDGEVYILPAGKTGAEWGAMANNALAYYRDGVWEEITPREGWLAHVNDTDIMKTYDGAAWVRLLLDSANEFTGGNTFSGGFLVKSSNDGASLGPTIDLSAFPPLPPPMTAWRVSAGLGAIAPGLKPRTPSSLAASSTPRTPPRMAQSM
jgi:hypothetical protein